jgi:hypothetical protein
VTLSRRQVLPAVLAVLLSAASGCALIDRMSGVAEAKRLQESGLPATAKILDLWDTGITVNDDPVISLRVEVSRPDGSVYSVIIPKSLVSRLDLPRFQPGSTVSVRIDPKDATVVALDEYRYH